MSYRRPTESATLGVGVGLRRQHIEAILSERPPVRWFEAIPENFLDRGGYCADALERIGEHYRLIAHGVSLSIGSTDPLDLKHLRRLRDFCDRLGSPWFSDHLCFTMVDHVNLNDLIPLPFTHEAVRHVAERVKIVRDAIERPFLLENVSYYMAPSCSEMSESQFITELLERADCGLLLDVSNVVLNAANHRFEAEAFIDSIPLDRVTQIHVAGYEPQGDLLVDTHGAPVSPETWRLLQTVVLRTGPVATLVEWDADIPPLSRLLAEADTAQAKIDETLATSPPVV